MRFSLFLRVAAIFSVMAFASVSEAQEKKVGLVIGLPLDVGVLWQTSERVALRADVGFGFNTYESSNESGLSLGSGVLSTITTTSSSSTTTIGLSALFTIRNDDNLRLYIAPRGAIELAHHSFETEIVPPLPAELSRLGLAGEVSDSSEGYEFDAMFGGQYRLRDRLALFGETGLAYRRSVFPSLTTTLSIGSVSTTRSRPDNRTTNVALRSSVGLVLFF